MTSKIQLEINAIKEKRIKEDLERLGKEFFKLDRYRNGFKANEKQKEFMIETYNKQYENAVSVGKRFGVSSTWINARLKKWGIPIKSATELFRLYDYNEDYFETIDTEDKAYWLGFIFADGSLTYMKKERSGKYRNVMRISLQAKDISHLEKFADRIGISNYKFETSKTIVQGIEYEYVSFRVTSHKLLKDLIDKGMIPTNNKLNKDKKELIRFPSNDKVPQHLLKHFVRGYFDGDGSLTRQRVKGKVIDTQHYTVKFVGNEVFCQQLKDFFKLSDLKDYNPETKSVYKKKDENYLYSFESGGNHRVFHIYNKFYKKANTFLERKHEEFQTFIDYFKENNYDDEGKYMERPIHHDRRINNKTNKLIYK